MLDTLAAQYTLVLISGRIKVYYRVKQQAAWWLPIAPIVGVAECCE